MASMVHGIKKAHSDILSLTPSTEEEKIGVVNELESRGNAAFKSRRAEEAEFLYSAALDIDEKNWAIFGNRSAVNEMMGKGEKALSDANSAIALKPDWAKAFFRQGKAFACLKQYEKSTEAFSRALALEPGSKMLKKCVDKAKKLEASAKVEAEKKAAEKKRAQTQTPTKTQMAAPTMTKVSKSKTTSNTPTDSSMRGYKKTSDGRTTSYFNMEIDANAKELIGDIAPKKMMNAPVVDPDQIAQGASAWNKGGTTEIRDATRVTTEWLTTKLNENVKVSGVELTMKLKELDGDASVVLRTGKKRYVFDFEIEVAVTVDGVGSFDLSTTDFGSEAEGSVEFQCVAEKTAKKDAVKAWLKKENGSLQSLLNAVWEEFITFYRAVM